MNSDGRNLRVYIVDDDAAMRDSLGLLLDLHGYSTVRFAGAEALLDAWNSQWAGCIVADLKLPGKSGLEMQAELRARGSTIPVVIITAHGDVSSARAAFLAQAVDFLEKPFSESALLAAIELSMQRERDRTFGIRQLAEREDIIRSLTPREREVLELVSRGLHGKEIASELSICLRTVESHKARLMSKLKARNVSELVRFALQRPD